MDKIKILIVDDSIIIRKTLTAVLSKEPDLEVVGAARNGIEALAMHQRLKPHVITLDVVMPGMDGLETLSRLRAVDREVTVIMFSSLTGKGAEATVEALARGANDYVMKPTTAGDTTRALDTIRRQLAPKVRALVSVLRRKGESELGEETMLAIDRSVAEGAGVRYRPPDIVAIGVSTGGPEALSVVLPSLPESFPVPVVVVQHMPALFVKVLVDRLDGQCKMRVIEADNGQPLEAGCAYFAPGDHHLLVTRTDEVYRASIKNGPPVNSCRPSVDVLFQALARCAGDRVLGLVLTGMGRDGLDGCRSLTASGSRIWVQDAESSVVWGMPGVVARAGLARRVLPLQEIARALAGTVGMRKRRSPFDT